MTKNKYSKLQKQLHNDIQLLICNNQYNKLSIDECAIVFARIYSAHMLAQLINEKKLIIKKVD